MVSVLAYFLSGFLAVLTFFAILAVVAGVCVGAISLWRYLKSEYVGPNSPSKFFGNYFASLIRGKSTQNSPVLVGPPAEKNELDVDKVYAIHRKYIEHEDALINQRTTLMVTVQGFLLAAFGLALQKFYEKVNKPNSCNFDEKIYYPLETILNVAQNFLSPRAFPDVVVLEFNVYLIILMMIGLATSIIGSISIVAAREAILRLEGHWNLYYYGCTVRPEEEAERKLLPGIAGGGNIKNREKGISFVGWLPAFFVWLWILMLSARLIFMLMEAVCLAPMGGGHGP